MRSVYGALTVSLGLLGLLVGCETPMGEATAMTLAPPPQPLLTPTRPVRPVVYVPPKPPPPAPRLQPRPVRDLVGRKIMVDPGHGHPDPGALGVGPKPEKVVVLEISRKLRTLLEQRGATVIMTRDSDKIVDLDHRGVLADKQRVDLFISVHADALPPGRSHIRGGTIYIARNAHPLSQSAGKEILAAFERAGLGPRGLRRAGFRGLVGHSRPAVLVETGYLTNYREARELATPAYQQRVAAAIADGVGRHFAKR